MRIAIIIGVVVVVALAIWLAPSDEEPSFSMQYEGDDPRVGSTRAWHYFNVTALPPTPLAEVSVTWPNAWEWLSTDETLQTGDLLRIEQADPGAHELEVRAGKYTWRYEVNEPDVGVHIWHSDSITTGSNFTEVFSVTFVAEPIELREVRITSDGQFTAVVWKSVDMLLSIGDRFEFEQQTIDQPRILHVLAPSWQISTNYGGGAGTPV